MKSLWWQDKKKSLHYSVDSYQIHFPVVWLTPEQELAILMVLVLILMYVFVGLPFNSLRNITVADAVGPCPQHLPLPLQWTLVGIPSASTCISSPEGFWPAHLLAGQKFQRINTLQEKPSTNGWWKFVYKYPCPLPHPLVGWLCSPCSMQSLRILQWD